MRSASSAVVIEPSTSERSYGPATGALDASRKYAISTSPGEREQLVLAVEHAELAAVAGRELPDRELGLAAPSQSSRTRSSGSTRSQGNTGPSWQMNSGPSWQWPHSPIAHFMLRSSET